MKCNTLRLGFYSIGGNKGTGKNRNIYLLKPDIVMMRESDGKIVIVIQ